MQPIKGVEFVCGDFSTAEAQQRLLKRLNGKGPDLILSYASHRTAAR